jgi:hypothetical protein
VDLVTLFREYIFALLQEGSLDGKHINVRNLIPLSEALKLCEFVLNIDPYDCVALFYKSKASILSGQFQGKFPFS